MPNKLGYLRHTYHSGGGWLQATSRTSDVLVQEKDSMLFWKVFRYIVDTTREEIQKNILESL